MRAPWWLADAEVQQQQPDAEAPKSPSTKELGKRQRGLLQVVGDFTAKAWKVVLVVVTVASIAMAVDAVIKLKSQPLTLDNIVPVMTNLLPAFGFGAAGLFRLVGLLVRVARVAITVPVVLGGAYLAAPSLPDLLRHSPDLAAGGLVALLATPEVLEVLALCAVVGGSTFWLAQKLFGLAAGAANAAAALRERGDEAGE